MELTASTSSLSLNKSHRPFISPLFSSCSRRRLSFPARAPPKVLYQSCEPIWCRPVWRNVRGAVLCSSDVRLKSPESRKDGNLMSFGGLGKWGVLIAVLGYSVIKCQRVLAAEGFVAASQVYLKDNWPKILQVLGVFKEQGLILSMLLGLSAFFSMAETSITTLWPWKVRELAEKEPEDGVFRMLRSDVTRFLTTILIGTTVVNIGATALVTEAATTLFGEAGITAATGVMTVAILLLTEITPKSIAVHHATEVARFVVRPVAWLSLILYPVGRIVTFLSMGMLKLLGLKARR